MEKEYFDWLKKYDLEDNDDNRYLYDVKSDMGWWFDEYFEAKENGCLSDNLIRAIEGK